MNDVEKINAATAAVRARRRPGFAHNVIAHPLLVICPPLGEWLHARTRPTTPRPTSGGKP